MDSVVKHWNRLPMEAVVSPPPGIFKIHADVCSGMWFSGGLAVLCWWLDSMILIILSNQNNSVIFLFTNIHLHHCVSHWTVKHCAGEDARQCTMDARKE